MQQPLYTKLNLGCGEDKKEGYVNVDFHDHVQPDVVHNLNQLPYPFPDNSFELVEAFHILEHLDRPFEIMKELHRIMKPGGLLHIKVPHFSRALTHSEHKAGFDVVFPYYFNKNFTKSGYFGVEFDHQKTTLHWMTFFHLMKYMGVSSLTIGILKTFNGVINFLANSGQNFCSRIWCFWVGGFEEIEYELLCKKN